MTEVAVFDDTRCALGEGPLWHPERRELFWFDIDACRLYCRGSEGRRMWQFDEHVTAAGWLDAESLLVASETALLRFEIATGASERVSALEADNPVTRSNDGRADPWGGFWIGTMGKAKEEGAGAIYRYHRGELRKLYAPWSIPNAICFAPDGGHAYLTDTPLGIVWRQRLGAKDGWPEGEPETYLTLPASAYRPDGAVVDRDGNFWCAHFGQGKVTCHDPKGRETASIPLPARQTTCPAFGGDGLATLFVTSAGRGPEADNPAGGQTFALAPGALGQAEHRVIL